MCAGLLVTAAIAFVPSRSPGLDLHEDAPTHVSAPVSILANAPKLQAVKAVGDASYVGMPGQAAHASTLSVSALGLMEAVWFSGSREGAGDVSILRATRGGDAWSNPTPIVSRRDLQLSSMRHVRKLGNPVQYIDAQGREHWFVVSVSLGGWAGARVEQWSSPVKGETPVFKTTLPLSPFINISTLVRAPAQSLAGGGFVLPAYHEFLDKAPELLLFDAQGQFVERRRDIRNDGLLQPALLASKHDRPWRAWHRDQNGREGRLFFTQISASTVTHQVTNLPNRDTGIAAIDLPDGRVLVAHNPGDRSTLSLSSSKDGVSFAAGVVVESTPGKEFSYPSLAFHADQLWLSYTADRKRIAIRAIDWRALP